MSVVTLLRILRKHMVLLFLMPILLAVLVIVLTKNPSFTFSSETTLYTGLASGSSVELGKAVNYFATTTDFDNLINVINSRETQQEVSIRLLAQHLMLSKADPRYISPKAFDYLKKITPLYIRKIVENSRIEANNSLTQKPVVTKNIQNENIKSENSQNKLSQAQNKELVQHTVSQGETLFSISRMYGIEVDQLREFNNIKGNNIVVGQKLNVGSQLVKSSEIVSDTTSLSNQTDSTTTFSFSNLYPTSQGTKSLPSSIDEAVFEQTVKNLTKVCTSSDTNFVSHLLSYDNPHYSIEAISTITVLRIGSSDLVKLKYTADDPGICQQTLIFLTDVLIKNYKVLKENRSDAVVKYFEYQVNQATQKLKLGEDRLLAFNKDNKIINYYEQSKAVAGAKEALDVDYNNMKIKLAGFEAEIKRLEEKLESQQKIYLKSAPIVEKRNQLAIINTKIATAETIGNINNDQIENLASLKIKADKLKDEIRESVNELYRFGHSTEGLPLATLLNEWISNVLKYEDMKAGLGVLSKRIQDFQKQYDIYAPAGANLKRIEREISVSEHEFLELLHGLNLAKLKMQDLELASNLKAIDQPFYPIIPNPTKRKFLIIGAAFFGFLIVFSTIMALEFFDDTLRNPKNAAKKLGLIPLGPFPKIYLKTEILNFSNIVQRLLEIMIQQIESMRKEKSSPGEPFQILVFSTITNEGKTVIAQNLASLLKKVGNKVIVIRHSAEKSYQDSKNQDYYAGALITSKIEKRPTKSFSWINWILGYPDDRVDYQSPFLSEDGTVLSNEEFFEYTIDDQFLHLQDYRELLHRNNHNLSFIPDYVLIEIPSTLYYPYPPALVQSADLPLMVCRSNRVWSTADQGSLDHFTKVASNSPLFILNGVEMDVVESILGQLPKKRNWIRRVLKKIIMLDFKSGSRL